MHTIKPIAPYSKMIHGSRRLLIRPYRISDRALCKAAKEKLLAPQNKYDGEFPVFKDLSPTGFKERLKKYRRRAKELEHFVFGVFLRENMEHLGDVDIYIINGELRWANLGYQIHNHCWNNGYASEASRLALELSFNVLNLSRVEASTEIGNIAARKVAIKAGMICEGIRKNFFEDIDYVVFGADSISYTRVQ
jgi:RimJ/RimL family protein N-acetyltransferase